MSEETIQVSEPEIANTAIDVTTLESTWRRFIAPLGSKRLPSSREVFSWPEFQAFAKRLGIPDLKTTNLSIRLNLEDVVRVTHEYLGENEQVKDDE